MMKFNCLLLFALAISLLTACQKDYVLTNPGITTTDTTGGGKTDGNILVKAYTVDKNNDTGFVYLRWDANNRLISYSSAGKVNSTPTNADYSITRAANGHITKIFKSHLRPSQEVWILLFLMPITSPIPTSFLMLYLHSTPFFKF